MVGLDNPLHIAMLLVVVLLVFGAKRLPEMGRSLGEGLRGFKDSVSGDSAPPMLANKAVDVEPPSAPTTSAAPAPTEPAPTAPTTSAAPATTEPAPTTERAPAQPVA